MNSKQKKFCDEYFIDLNATQAAMRAGYSDKTAYSIGQRLLKNVEVQNYIREQLEKMHSEKTADAQEIMEYLTTVMRGVSVSEEIAVIGIGDGISEVEKVSKKPSEKDRLKAAELLGKRYGLFNADKNEKSDSDGVTIVDDIKSEIE